MKKKPSFVNNNNHSKDILTILILILAALIIPGCTSSSIPTSIPTPFQPTQEQIPSSELPQPEVPPIGATLTPFPTLGNTTNWREPEASRSIVFALPASTGGQDIYLLSPQAEPPLRLANITDELLLRVAASPDGKYLAIHTSPRTTGYNQSLTLLSLSDYKLKPVVQESWIISWSWSTDGKRIAFSESREAGMLNIYILDVETGSMDLVFDGAGGGKWDVKGWVMSDQMLLVSHLAGGGLMIDQALLIDVSSKQTEIIYSDSNKLTGNIIPVAGGQVALVSQREKMGDLKAKLLVLDLNTGQSTVLVDPESPYSSIINGPILSPDNRYAAFMSVSSAEKGVDAIVNIMLLDVTTGETSVVFQGSYASSRVLAWASDTVLIVSNLGEEMDQTLYSIHTDGSHPQKILTISGGQFLTTIP